MTAILLDSSIQDLTFFSGGKGVSYSCRMGVMAKKMLPDSDSPYELFNEIVGATLASLCGLPVLVPAVFRHNHDFYTVTPFIVSYDEGTPPPTGNEIRRKLKENPRFLHGMILIDVWLGNNDRKADNILYGIYSNEVYLIDYGNSLLYRGRERGVERLNSLSIMPSNFDSEKKPYHYKDILENETLVHFWAERIRSIPDWMIEEIIRKGAQSLYLLDPQIQIENIEIATWNFLQSRRIQMEELIVNMAQEGIFVNYKYTQREEKSQ
jgi:hypothetical protein